MKEPEILNAQNWLYKKFYRVPKDDDTWKSQLDWCHTVVRTIVKPWVAENPEIEFFFGISWL